MCVCVTPGFSSVSGERAGGPVAGDKGREVCVCVSGVGGGGQPYGKSGTAY